jgi:hypothetical protein
MAIVFLHPINDNPMVACRVESFSGFIINLVYVQKSRSVTARAGCAHKSISFSLCAGRSLHARHTFGVSSIVGATGSSTLSVAGWMPQAWHAMSFIVSQVIGSLVMGQSSIS